MLPFEIENRLGDIRREIESLGAELIELTVRRSGGRSALVITADKLGGITLDECAKINGHLSRYLDEFPGESGFFHSPYYLEVNSPGLDRPLRTEKDFLRAKDQMVRIAFKAANGAGLLRVGQVIEVQNGVLKLKIPQEESLLAVPLETITKANLEIKIGK